jgi:hypothetical protein
VRAVVVKTINSMLVFSLRNPNTGMDERMERQKEGHLRSSWDPKLLCDDTAVVIRYETIPGIGVRSIIAAVAAGIPMGMGDSAERRRVHGGSPGDEKRGGGGNCASP